MSFRQFLLLICGDFYGVKDYSKKEHTYYTSFQKSEKTEVLKRRAMHDTYAELSSKTTTQWGFAIQEDQRKKWSLVQEPIFCLGMWLEGTTITNVLLSFWFLKKQSKIFKMVLNLQREMKLKKKNNKSHFCQ